MAGDLVAPDLGARVAGAAAPPRLGPCREGAEIEPRLGAARAEGAAVPPLAGALADGTEVVPVRFDGGDPTVGLRLPPETGALADGLLGAAVPAPDLAAGCCVSDRPWTLVEGLWEGVPAVGRFVAEGAPALERPDGARTAGVALPPRAPAPAMRSEGRRLGVGCAAVPLGVPGRAAPWVTPTWGRAAPVEGAPGRAVLVDGVPAPGRALPARSVPGWATPIPPARGSAAGAAATPDLGLAVRGADAVRTGDSLKVVPRYPRWGAPALTIPRAGTTYATRVYPGFTYHGSL